MVSIIIHDRHGRSRVIDAGAQGSQGTVGTAYGGTPRHAPRVQKAPGVKAGGFTVDQPPVPRLPGAMAGSTHQAAAQQHEALAAHHQGLNYGAQNPVSRAHAEAAKAHKAAHSLLGKPGYNQAANWANSATEHAGRLSKPQDAAPPPPKPPQARMGPQQTGPDIKAGSNRPMPNPRPAPQPYRGYDAAASPRAAGTPQPPKPPTPPKPPLPKPPPAAAAPKPPPPPAAKAPPAAPAPKTAGHGANPVQTALHGVAGALHGVRSATETGNWLLSLQQGRVGDWFHDAGTSLGARRAHSTRRRLKAEDEAKERRSWLDNWFSTKKPAGYSDRRTIDEWFHDFDESKTKRGASAPGHSKGEFAKGNAGGGSAGKSEAKPSGGGKKRATNIQVKPGTRAPGRGAQQPPAETPKPEGKKADTTVGIKARNGKERDEVVADWQAESPLTSVDAWMKIAKSDQDYLVMLAKEAAEAAKTGKGVADPGPKTKARIEDKLARNGKPPNKLTDVVRCGFKVDHPEQADKIIEHLSQNFPIADEGWAKTPAGYFDRKAMVLMPSGAVAEIQVWPPGMFEAKEEQGGHKLYEDWQATPKESEKWFDLQNQMNTLYSGVLSKLPSSWKGIA
jgi:hypothetical protein